MTMLWQICVTFYFFKSNRPNMVRVARQKSSSWTQLFRLLQDSPFFSAFIKKYVGTKTILSPVSGICIQNLRIIFRFWQFTNGTDDRVNASPFFHAVTAVTIVRMGVMKSNVWSSYQEKLDSGKCVGGCSVWQIFDPASMTVKGVGA